MVLGVDADVEMQPLGDGRDPAEVEWTELHFLSNMENKQEETVAKMMLRH